jgi:glycosyltransferase involved in cell wall biosynthesis
VEQKRAARIQVRRDLGLPVDAAIVGVFGSHIVRKRTHVLADVLAQVLYTADSRPVYGLACGGPSAPCDTELDEKINRYGLASRLLRPGFVRPVEQWMSACDVVLAPAIQEPLARSVLEAQALHIPAIVSTDGGLRELIEDGHTGILCDPYDLEDWIGATRRLLDDRELAGALAAAAHEVVVRLKPERHAQRVAAIYQAALSNARGSEAA